MRLSKEEFSCVEIRLLNEGWRFVDSGIIRDSNGYFHKRFDTPSRCFHNQEKDGVQVLILRYDFSKFPQYGPKPIGLTLDLQSTMMSERTVGLNVHHMKDLDPWTVEGCTKEINKHVALLIELWEHANRLTREPKIGCPPQ